MTYPPNPPVATPKKRMATWKKIGVGVGVFFLLSGCVAAIGDVEDTGSSEDTAPQADVSAEPAEAAAPEEEEEGPSTVGDGIHRVGDDIDPGTYSTEGPDPDGLVPSCYYARLSGLSGEFDEIISNHNTEGPSTVEVADSDAALELSGGCEWELLD